MLTNRQNPMIGDTPEETIEMSVAALRWLTTADRGITHALAGSPSEELEYGRTCLAECCLAALDSARQTIEASKVKLAA